MICINVSIGHANMCIHRVSHDRLSCVLDTELHFYLIMKPLTTCKVHNVVIHTSCTEWSRLVQYRVKSFDIGRSKNYDLNDRQNLAYSYISYIIRYVYRERDTVLGWNMRIQLTLQTRIVSGGILARRTDTDLSADQNHLVNLDGRHWRWNIHYVISYICY